MLHKIALLGQPGTGKSTAGLSYPGVNQHVFGGSEDATQEAFKEKGHIRGTVKFNWYECLSPEEKKKFEDEGVPETEIALLTKKARCKNIAKYRRYVYKLKNELATLPEAERAKRTEFLDNLTPFSEEFQAYVEYLYKDEFETKGGNFDSIAFARKYKNEMTDFLRLFYSLECNVVVSCHVAMTVDQESAANVNFLQQSTVKVNKEWHPLIMGQTKFVFAGIPDFAFFMWVEENAGQANKYYAKIIADEANVGIGKARIQPFERPNKIPIPPFRFYQFLEEQLTKYKQGGK